MTETGPRLEKLKMPGRGRVGIGIFFIAEAGPGFIFFFIAGAGIYLFIAGAGPGIIFFLLPGPGQD